MKGKVLRRSYLIEQKPLTKFRRYPLSHNVFTSLHIFRLVDPGNTYPYDLTSSKENTSFTQRILRIYCLAVIKSCQSTLR